MRGTALWTAAAAAQEYFCLKCVVLSFQINRNCVLETVIHCNFAVCALFSENFSHTPWYSGETGGTSVCQPNIVQLIPFAEFSEGFCLSQQLLEDERQGEGGCRGIARCSVQEQGEDGR